MADYPPLILPSSQWNMPQFPYLRAMPEPSNTTATTQSDIEVPEFLAAVDLGSNSFHMKIARVVDGELRVVDRLREMVRLAAGLDAENTLSAETRECAVSCLQRFGQRLCNLPSENVRAVGTNTLRRAHNASTFLARSEDALGHRIEIIAGREEARLIYIGVAHGTAHDHGQRLVVDIGGGSTELIIGRQFTPEHMESLYMGCVSSSLRYFADGKIRKKSFRDAQLAAERELEPIQARYKAVGWDEVIGASGTVRAVLGAIRSAGWGNDFITADGLTKLRDALIDAGDMRELPGMLAQPERAPVFPGGVAVLLGVFHALDLERMLVSNSALREGVLYDLLGRFGMEDVRETTIRYVSNRYQVDMEQGVRVEETALYLLGQAARSWRLQSERYRNALSWAARLHEIGLDIAHNEYHKHGGYLLVHADLPGFSRQEQELLAVLVRAHRRKFPVEVFSNLSGKVGDRARCLAIVLRIAVLLHRSRDTESLPAMLAHAEQDALKLAFPPGWMARHPLTQSGLEEEAGYLQAAGITFTYA